MGDAQGPDSREDRDASEGSRAWGRVWDTNEQGLGLGDVDALTRGLGEGGEGGEHGLEGGL
jgi:hypothetical protein